jgi:hypothetical protein
MSAIAGRAAVVRASFDGAVFSLVPDKGKVEEITKWIRPDSAGF